MAFRATHKYARISARKVRPLADLVRGKFADEALNILKYQPHRGARMLEKVLRSAVGNAQDPDQNKGTNLSAERLVVTDARIDGGPTFKRIRPRARGMAFGILRRTAHITVELQSIDDM
jgi:large subunit ribosomal protein L22